MKANFDYPLILASSSPRRRRLMRQAGYTFEVVPCTLTEPTPPCSANLAPAVWAEAMAYFKAGHVAQFHPDAIIIGADTIVSHMGRITGKPRDREHARYILSNLFQGPQDVITALTVLCPPQNKRLITHVCTKLVMRAMTSAELENYLESGYWRDKAGAYALQETNDPFVQNIQGSVSNIVGLPLEKLHEILALEYFLTPPTTPQ